MLSLRMRHREAVRSHRPTMILHIIQGKLLSLQGPMQVHLSWNWRYRGIRLVLKSYSTLRIGLINVTKPEKLAEYRFGTLEVFFAQIVLHMIGVRTILAYGTRMPLPTSLVCSRIQNTKRRARPIRVMQGGWDHVRLIPHLRS